MEPSPELSGERGITLVSPEDKLNINSLGNHFISKGRMVPDLGMVYLDGTTIFSYKDDDSGVTIIKDQIVIKRANELADMGLFELGINVHDLRTQTTCKMMLYNYSLKLESEMELVEEELTKEDPLIYYGLVNKWKMRGDDRELLFFAPADPKFLSQLRFSFSQIHDPPESPK